MAIQIATEELQAYKNSLFNQFQELSLHTLQTASLERDECYGRYQQAISCMEDIEHVVIQAKKEKRSMKKRSGHAQQQPDNGIENEANSSQEPCVTSPHSLHSQYHLHTHQKEDEDEGWLLSVEVFFFLHVHSISSIMLCIFIPFFLFTMIAYRMTYYRDS